MDRRINWILCGHSQFIPLSEPSLWCSLVSGFLPVAGKREHLFIFLRLFFTSSKEGPPFQSQVYRNSTVSTERKQASEVKRPSPWKRKWLKRILKSGEWKCLYRHHLLHIRYFMSAVQQLQEAEIKRLAPRFHSWEIYRDKIQTLYCLNQCWNS